jgi:hypothetical protein
MCAIKPDTAGKPVVFFCDYTRRLLAKNYLNLY